MFKRITLLFVICSVFMLCISINSLAYAEDIPEPGLEKALAKADAFNAWMRECTDQEIADEMGISVWTVLSPYGTEAPPEPLITVSEGDTWDDLVHRLLEKYGVDEESVGIGYYNTVTGEEHYINPDQYMVSASMFKVPLNMIFADKISSGEMALDTDIWGMPYNWYQYKSIVESDNERSYTLMQWLGGYSFFKDLQIPYLGNDPRDDLGDAYGNDNYYNARQFIHVLQMLYDEPARFPGILENMLQA